MADQPERGVLGEPDQPLPEQPGADDHREQRRATARRGALLPRRHPIGAVANSHLQESPRRSGFPDRRFWFGKQPFWSKTHGKFVRVRGLAILQRERDNQLDSTSKRTEDS